MQSPEFRTSAVTATHLSNTTMGSPVMKKAKSGQSHVTVHSALEEMRGIDSPIERYLYIRSLRREASAVFYALLYMHVQEVLPYVYTPTVGEACQKYHKLPIRTWGLYLSYEDKGTLLMKMKQFTQQQIKVIVVTDGERILGLGDLGTGGMVCSTSAAVCLGNKARPCQLLQVSAKASRALQGISEGKIMLYTVAAGALLVVGAL